MTSLLVFPASTSSFTDVGQLRRDRVVRRDISGPASSCDYELPLDRSQAYDWILKRCLERVSDTRAYKAHVHPLVPATEAVAKPRVPLKRQFEDFSIDYPPTMADRRSSRRIAQNVASQQSSPPAQHSRGTRSSARKEDTLDSIVVSQPSTRSHTRTASVENAKPPVPKSSSNIRSVPAGRSTRTSAAANTRSQPARTSGRSQPARRAAAAASTNTRSRNRVPSSDSEDDDSNIDIADDDDVEASQESEEEEEEEEEEESEPAPKRPSRGAGTRQMPARRAAKAVFSDEDAPGETDDGMELDDAPVATAQGSARGKMAAISDDEDAEGEPDDEDMGPIVRAPTAKAIPRSVPVPKIIEPDSDDEEEEDDDDDEEDEDDEDAEGEDVDDEDDEDMDESMMATPDISRPDTPNLKGLTRRQLGKVDSVYAQDLMELPDDFGTTKKAAPLTAAEQASRRAEMARRRKNQSEQRREEEKMETINKLLKRQATKVNRRSQKQLEDDNAADEAAEAGEPEPTEPPKMLRWVSTKKGQFVGVPQSWLDAPAGEIYKTPQHDPWRGKLKRVGLVEELPDQIMGDA